MRGVYFRNEQRNVRGHAMIFRIADHRVASASELFFRWAGDGRIERRENKIAIEFWFEALDEEIAGALGNGPVEVPVGGFRVASCRKSAPRRRLR